MQTEDSRAVAETFDPARVRIAREASGLLQRELAERIRVSAAAVSQYESGRARPSPDTLQEIARCLGYPVTFFSSDRPADEARAAGGFFRKLSRAPARDRARAMVIPLLVRDLVNTIEWYIRLPKVEIPQLDVVRTTMDSEIEDIAQEVRRSWAVPEGPIEHVVRLMELHGIVVIRFPSGGDTLDAFSCSLPERPVVVLYSDKEDASRSRFDAAHELGHLVMHRHAPQDADWVEKQANYFAAAFLTPADSIKSHLPETLSWAEFIRLKQRWGISIAALLRRAYHLGRLTDDQYQKAMKALSARGWRKQEPGSLGKPEAPLLLERAVALLEREGVSVEDLAYQAKLPLNEVRTWLDAGSDPRPALQLEP